MNCFLRIIVFSGTLSCLRIQAGSCLFGEFLRGLGAEADYFFTYLLEDTTSCQTGSH
ncbi:hypothetical protein LINGRAPRIM_LOCUS861 [Linum grandiflorum]